ncbi:T9SS type A sorting domain-containing protein [Hymenobacter sp. NBH84]|uniref:heparinase II/III domain-containing protein n=1 Tax=Hymenobacter sp. NBH84 TaxID=2596915 RepID=UPI001623BAC8|nr:heparinase II/III family protein [Hymenobacter sp. NBH84]QNE38931.1 T9SS type A sorting domain-containing protein [Hymenobacter sp. NBH84]
MKTSLLYLFLLCFACQAVAQQGSWMPADADSSYPRTLLKAAELPAVQTSLATSANYVLYSGLFNSINTAPPTDTASTNGRRDRATFAKNTAFVLLLDRRPVSPGELVPLTANERAALLTNATTLLATLNFQVSAWPSYNDWQWRSKELIDYLIAYDLLRGAGVPEQELTTSRAKLQKFAGNLQTQSVASFFGIRFYSTIKNNHTLMTAAALGMAAVVLNDATSTIAHQQPATWIATGLYNIDNVLWQDAQRQSDPAAVAGYAEGPYYFKYAFLNCLPFFRAMGHFLPTGALPYTFNGTTRTIPNPYFDPRYDRLYQWITAILMPDGRFPALEDSYVDMGMPELALTGNPAYVRPLHLSKLAPNQLNSLTAQLRDITVDMRAPYLAANITPTPTPSIPLTALPQSGNLIFRSGSDSLASYLHLYGKSQQARTTSGGHRHADVGSFALHAYGQLLALDAGYLSFDRRNEVKEATSHNMVLVDGAGPASDATSAVGTVQHTFQTEKLSYGEVQSAYAGTTVTRKAMFVRNSYYLLADFVQSSAPHAYTWQLHGYGLENGTATTGTFQNNPAAHEGTWLKNGVQLLAHVTATAGATSYATTTSAHEVTYNTPENHTTLLVRKEGSAQTQFLAALYPYTDQPTLSPSTTSTSTTAGLALASDFQDVVFAQSDTVLARDESDLLPQAVSADGLLTFYSLDKADQFAQLFLQQGTTIRYGSATMLASSRRADISWQRLSTNLYGGYVSRATTLMLPMATAPQIVMGTGVAEYQYDAAAQQLRVTLAEATEFRVATTPGTPLPVVLTSFGAQRQEVGVQLRWQTATESQNWGFTIQRSTDGVTFATLTSVARAGTSNAAHRYAYHDATAPQTLTYYRLQQQDHDGTVGYSPIVAVAASPSTLTVAPIPAQDFLTVTYPDSPAEIHLTLFDQQGRQVLQTNFRQQTQLSVAALANGLYILRATDTNGQPIGRAQRVLIAH